MSNKKIICPFCGKNISDEWMFFHSIPQEETISRKHSIESHWFAGSYITETKQVRHFNALCCDECYDEYSKYEKWTDRYAIFALPIGLIAGILVYFLVIHEGQDVSFWTLVARIVICGMLGMLIIDIPNIILNLIFSKKTSYDKAKSCNAIREYIS